jgi:hypothetical protein
MQHNQPLRPHVTQKDNQTEQTHINIIRKDEKKKQAKQDNHMEIMIKLTSCMCKVKVKIKKIFVSSYIKRKVILFIKAEVC